MTIFNYAKFPQSNEPLNDTGLLWLVHWTPDREVRFQVLAGSMCCVLGEDTLLSQCLLPPRSINGYTEKSGYRLEKHGISSGTDKAYGLSTD